MKRSTSVVLLLTAAGIAAASSWGVERGLGQNRDRASARPAIFRTTIYFLTSNGTAPLGVRRTLVKRPPYEGASLRAALASMFAGPTKAERHAGLTSAIPKATRLLSLSFKGRAGGDAVLNLHGLPTEERAYRTAEVITQIARTTIGLSGIRRVWLRDDGRVWGLRDFQGRIQDVPHDYSELLGFNIGTPNGPFSALP
ncbi:MAG TPA: GerMN domain-containing protein [Gaiellaceae bacterium]|nr:GerMN domain-containing protein [Gaiellaceae bacterium]